MSAPEILTAAFGDYDRTEDLHTGRITVPGIRLASVALPPAQLFPRAFRRAEFDVSELSFSTQMIVHSRGAADYVALPIFLSRSFRFDSIYVRSGSEVRVPADLQGRRVGIPEFQMTAAVWVRGILQDRFGVDLKSIQYSTGGLDRPGRTERVALALPPGWDVSPIGPDETLGELLLAGALDAVIAPQAPAAFQDGSGRLRRLFDDPGAAERLYFAETGIFPIMHAVGLRRPLHEAHPHLACALFNAFCQARDAAFKRLDAALRSPAPTVSLPWLGEELARTRELMGEDLWPYGVSANVDAISTLCRYMHEQGLLARPVATEELFPIEFYAETA